MLHPLTILRDSVRKEVESNNSLAVCGDSEAALHFDIQSDDYPDEIIWFSQTFHPENNISLLLKAPFWGTMHLLVNRTFAYQRIIVSILQSMILLAVVFVVIREEDGTVQDHL